MNDREENQKMRCGGKDGGKDSTVRRRERKERGEGRKGRERDRERETIKANEKTSTSSHYNSFPQDTLSSFQSGPFHLTCLPLPCPLIFTYPPELHLCLEHTVTIKDKVDMKLREKNRRGSNYPSSQDESWHRTGPQARPCIRRSAQHRTVT